MADALTPTFTPCCFDEVGATCMRSNKTLRCKFYQVCKDITTGKSHSDIYIFLYTTLLGFSLYFLKCIKNVKSMRKFNFVKNLKMSHRKNSRSVLESIRQAWHASVVWETGVAVARRDRRVKKRLLCGVMCLGLVLLSLS